MVTEYSTSSGVVEPATIDAASGVQLATRSTSDSTDVTTSNVSLPASGSESAVDVMLPVDVTVPVVEASMVYATVTLAGSAPAGSVAASSAHVSVGAGVIGVHVHPGAVTPWKVVPAGKSHVNDTPGASLGPLLNAEKVAEMGVADPASAVGELVTTVSPTSAAVWTATDNAPVSPEGSGSVLSDDTVAGADTGADTSEFTWAVSVSCGAEPVADTTPA